MASTAPVLLTFTISSGSSLSDAQYVGHRQPLGIHLPTIDSAKLSFVGSYDGATFFDVYDTSGSEVTEPSSTGELFQDAPDALRGVNWLKIRTGTSGSGASQSAERSIVVVCK